MSSDVAIQVKAYALGAMLGQMIGRQALENAALTQQTLELDDESTVCYLNGAQDAIMSS